MRHRLESWGKTALSAIALIVTVCVAAYLIVGLGYLFNNSQSLVSNETVVAMLTFMLAVVGFTNYFFYQVAYHRLSQSIRQKAVELSSSERNAAKIETKVALSYTLWTLFRKQNDEGYLEHAISGAEFGARLAKDLDGNEYPDAVIAIENTLAYLLAERQNIRNGKGQPPIPKDRKMAEGIADKLTGLLETGQLQKMLPNRPPYKFEETCAWVRFCFADNEDDREQARRMVQGCLKDAPQDWSKEKVTQFKLPVPVGQ